MKTKHIIAAFTLAFLCIGTTNAQLTSSTQRASLTDRDRAIVDQRVSKHTAFTIDKKELTNYLRSRGGEGQFRLRIDENLDWTINLELNDLRTPDFKITYTTAEGEFECKEPFVVNTYRGTTSTGLPVAFTIDENTFFGVILGENYHYMIRSAGDYTQNREDMRLIVYHSWDIIPDENYSHFEHDIIHDALHTPKENLEEFIEQNSINNFTNSSNNCDFVLKIATDADIEFFNIHGANTNNHIRSIINVVSAIYQDSIANFRIAISFQHVYAPGSNQPYTTSDVLPLLRDQFRHHWRTASNRTNVSRNITHLFTGKNLYEPRQDIWGNPTNVPYDGIAWGPHPQLPGGAFGVGNDNGYAISSNHARLTAIVAHEIGHNLTATHPEGNNINVCNCNNTSTATIMCPTLTNSSTLRFCPFSLGQIVSYLNSVNLQLVDICGTSTICSIATFYSTIPVAWDVSSGFEITWPAPSVGATTSVIVKAIGTHGQTGTLRAWAAGATHPVTMPIQACLICDFGTFGCGGWCHLCIPRCINGFPGCDGTMCILCNNPFCPWPCLCCPFKPCFCGFSPCICGPSPAPTPVSPFPNPVSDVLHIDLGQQTSTMCSCCSTKPAPEFIYDVRLIDGQGNIVRRQQQVRSGQVEFNVFNLTEGTYYLHIYNGVSRTPQKHQIVVKR